MGLFGKPIVVEWSADDGSQQGGSESKLDKEPPRSKKLSHEGISLVVDPPEFAAAGPSLYFSVSSLHKKSIGIGALGVAIDVGTGSQPCTDLSASVPVHTSRMRWDEPMRQTMGDTVTVNEFEMAHFDARFRPTRRPARAKAIIEAKRMFAPNFIFVFPFEYEAAGAKNENEQSLPPELQARLRRSAQDAAQVINEAVHLGFGIGIIQAADLTQIPERVIEELSKRNFPKAERNSQELAGTVLLAAQLLKQTRAAHTKHGSALADCEDPKCVEMRAALERTRSELVQGATR